MDVPAVGRGRMCMSRAYDGTRMITDIKIKMKRIIISALAALTLAACTPRQDNQQNTDNMDTTVNEVAGRKNFGPDHALMTTPQPCVMIATWDEHHNPDVMMAAWAGQFDYKQIVISLSKHKTTENIEKTGAFTIGFATEDDVVESDYFGLVSGNKVSDKVSKAGFTVIPSPNVDAPIIEQYRLTLECKVVSFTDGILIGEVVNMSADENILTDGRVDLAKLKPIVYDAAGMCYRSVGEAVGKAWNAGKALME